MSNTVKLEKECFVGNCTETAALILEALHGGNEVVVDGGEVERIDTSTVQVLLAARHQAESLGTPLRFVPSSVMKEFAARIGITL